MNENGWRTCFHAKRTGCSNATFLRRSWPARAFAWALAGAKNSTGCTWILSYQMIPAIASESPDSRDSPFFGPFFWWIHKTQNCGVVAGVVTSLKRVPSLWRHKSKHFFGVIRSLNHWDAAEVFHSQWLCLASNIVQSAHPSFRKYDSHIVNLWLYGMGWCMCVYIIFISLYYVHYIAKWDL